MEAKKTKSARQKIESLIDNIYLYRGRQVRVKGFGIGDDEIRIHNQGNTIIFPSEKLDQELAEFMPMDEPESEELVKHREQTERQAMTIFQGDANRMNKLEDVLVDNIKKLQESDEYLEQATEINNQVKTLLYMSKTKLKMHKEIRKSNKLTNNN